MKDNAEYIGLFMFLSRDLCQLNLDWLVVPKRLDHGSSHPAKPLRALAGTPTGRDDTVFWSVVFCFGVCWLFRKDWIPGRCLG